MLEILSYPFEGHEQNVLFDLFDGQHLSEADALPVILITNFQGFLTIVNCFIWKMPAIICRHAIL